MSDRSMIGWSALVIVCMIVLVVILENRTTAQLDVKLLFGTILVRNVGTGPITITRVTANNRSECTPWKSYSYAEEDRLDGKPASQKATLKVGELVSYGVPCNHLVRTAIITNAGTFEFTFD